MPINPPEAQEWAPAHDSGSRTRGPRLRHVLQTAPRSGEPQACSEPPGQKPPPAWPPLRQDSGHQARGQAALGPQPLARAPAAAGGSLPGKCSPKGETSHSPAGHHPSPDLGRPSPGPQPRGRSEGAVLCRKARGLPGLEPPWMKGGGLWAQLRVQGAPGPPAPPAQKTTRCPAMRTALRLGVWVPPPGMPSSASPEGATRPAPAPRLPAPPPAPNLV